MKIAVWGLGYVGTVSAACLAKLGHDVVGIEPNAKKVEALNSGESAILEDGLTELVKDAVAHSKLCATTDGIPWVADTDVSLICVGTPSFADGNADLTYLHNVARDIGQGLKRSQNYHTVILRSTVFPGVARDILIPALEEHSGRKAQLDFGVVVNPEFLRESTAIKDFFDPPYTIIGAIDERSQTVVDSIYSDIGAPILHLSMDEASLIKMTNNAFHGLKVAFANEIGRICEALGMDSHTVMQIVCSDTKLNISPAYLRPGFAFGGSCLPKDLRSLTFNSSTIGVKLPILDAILPSNRQQIDAARIKIHRTGAKRVAVLGLSFKAGTDDLRESPMLDLISELWRDGLDVLVYDPDVHLEHMLGSNRAYLERQLPQIQQIIRYDINEMLKDRELVVIAQKRPEFQEALNTLKDPTTVLDLVGINRDTMKDSSAAYMGLSW